MAGRTICSVCKDPLQGAYCTTCGQRYLGRRVNTWDVLGGWLSGLLAPERSVLGTFFLFIALFLWSARVFSPEGTSWWKILLNAVWSLLVLTLILAILFGGAYLFDPDGVIVQE